MILLWSDTYEKGKQDTFDAQSMDVSDEEEKEKEKDKDSEEGKPLLPPEVFKHLKTSAESEKKEKPPIGKCRCVIRPGSDNFSTAWVYLLWW